MEETLTKTKEKTEVVNIQDFYETFKNRYPKSYLGLSGRGKEKPSLSLCRKINHEYFDIFFKELYLDTRKSYFLFGGTIEVFSTPPTIKKIKKGGKEFYNKKGTSITLFWSGFPTSLFPKFLKLSKLTGKFNKIPVIEKLFRANFDVELLPKFDQSIVKNRIAKGWHYQKE